MLKFEDIEKIPDDFGKRTHKKYEELFQEVQKKLDKGGMWLIRVQTDTTNGVNSLQTSVRKRFGAKVDCLTEKRTRRAILKPNLLKA